MSTPLNDVLITVTDLADRLSRGVVRLLDVRWTLAAPDGQPAFQQGHVPGAIYVDLDHELAGQGEPADGRHPLPSEVEFERSVRSWGINPGELVVVYDDGGNMAAARAWWLLKYAGVEEVRILDGALGAWRAAGYPLETGPASRPANGTLTVRYGQLPVVDADGAAAAGARAALLDVRAPERFRGEFEPVDPRAGHIPGARNAPTGDNLDSAGFFLTIKELRERYADLGIDPGAEVTVYCGSGVTASHAAVALTLAGYRPILYPGSWSQWSNQPGRAVAVGD